MVQILRIKMLCAIVDLVKWIEYRIVSIYRLEIISYFFTKWHSLITFRIMTRPTFGVISEGLCTSVWCIVAGSALA